MVRFDRNNDMLARAMSTLLLLAGAALLVTWLVTPAASAPPPQAPAPHTALDDDAPLLADVNAQVLELRDRIGARPVYPPPVRDPFSYVTRTRQPRASVPSVVRESVEPPVPVGPAPPALVAILSASASSPRRAVLAAPGADDVQFVAAGGTIGRFVVRDIEDDVVILADPETNATTRLTLH
jgi:hypothetical protein